MKYTIFLGGIAGLRVWNILRRSSEEFLAETAFAPVPAGAGRVRVRSAWEGLPVLHRFAVANGRNGYGASKFGRGGSSQMMSGIRPGLENGNGATLRTDSGMIDRAAVEEEIPGEVRPWGKMVTAIGAAIFLALLLFTLLGPEPKRPESAQRRQPKGQRRVRIVDKRKPAAVAATATTPAAVEQPATTVGEAGQEAPPPSLPPLRPEPPRRAMKPRGGTVTLKNPSFEANSIPDAGEGDPEGWTRGGAGGGGISDASQPAATGTNIPDGKQVAHLPGGATLTQRGISGLSKYKEYWVQFFFSRRLDGGTPSLSISFAGQSIGTIGEIMTGADYEFACFKLRPSGMEGDLVFTNTAGDPSAVALIDCVSFVQRASDQVVIRNPSFDGSLPRDAFTDPDAPLGGWSSRGKVAVQQANGQGYHDNGLSDGPAFAVLSDEAWLRQTITGLEPGTRYELAYSFNARQENYGGTPTLRVTIGDIAVQDERVWAVGTFNPFLQMVFEFKADRPEIELEFRQTEPGDRTIFVDNITIHAIKEVVRIPDDE